MPLVRRRFRLTIELEVSIHDITDEQIEAAVERARSQGHGDPEWYRRAGERDRRLLRAVLRHPEIVGVILHGQTMLAAEDGVQSLLRDTDEEALLPAAIATLPPEDREFYEGVIAEGIFAENAEFYLDAGDFRTFRADLQEVPDQTDHA
jgi:hypothetical protein